MRATGGMRLEARASAPVWLLALTPVLAAAVTVVIGAVLFWVLGYPPLEAIKVYFIAPISDSYGLTELCIKATPLLLCALGLMLCFRAGIWNIGAEGQLAVGALVGGMVGLQLDQAAGAGIWLLPVMMAAGVVGGALWAAIPALLKTRFGANEILTSLMLTYVGLLLLSALVHGPLRDPLGFNFPQSRRLEDPALLPIMVEGTRLHAGVVLGLAGAVIAWFFMARHELGFGIKVFGLAPQAAQHAGFSPKKLTAGVLIASGGFAGLAGVIEVAGPIERLLPSVSPGYGFAAIIIAFLGRLNPIGVLLASFVLALSYLGGELAQVILKAPRSVTGVFQGVLLFTLLAFDLFIRYRVVFTRRAVE